MKKTGETDNKNSQGASWQKRPSEIKGYRLCYYITDKKRDYIRVDVNPKGKKVRLYIEVFSQGGCPYFSTIADGKVVLEKNMLTKRSFGFSNVFSERAPIVSTIPDEDVLEFFNGNYGIKATEAKEVARKKLLRETKERYFSKESLPNEYAASDSADEGKKSFIWRLFAGFIDVLIGAALSVSSFFVFGHSFVAFGVCLAFYGVILGGVDFFIKDKPPNVIKLLVFIFMGLASYIYGYYII